MLLIECPWCGPREETEFSCGGEAHIARPPSPDALADEAQTQIHAFVVAAGGAEPVAPPAPPQPPG